ncbi:RICIN domain-containing protein [Bacillus paranthracis]
MATMGIYKKMVQPIPLKMLRTGKYMAGSNIAYEAGTKVVLRNSPDYWKITSLGGNKYRIKHVASGKILDMPMNYLHDGATFQLFNGWSYISTNEAFFYSITCF